VKIFVAHKSKAESAGTQAAADDDSLLVRSRSALLFLSPTDVIAHGSSQHRLF